MRPSKAIERARCAASDAEACIEQTTALEAAARDFARSVESPGGAHGAAGPKIVVADADALAAGAASRLARSERLKGGLLIVGLRLGAAKGKRADESEGQEY